MNLQQIAFLKAKVEIIASHHPNPKRGTNLLRRHEPYWPHFKEHDYSLAQLQEFERDGIDGELAALPEEKRAAVNAELTERFGVTSL